MTLTRNTDLRGLGTQMDEMNVGYKPGQLYRGKGSNHGIDFENLINGGLGAAYDWREDPLAHLKGPSALQTLQKNREITAKYVSTTDILALGQFTVKQSFQNYNNNIVNKKSIN